eukprot:274232-Prorocentrum_minimum.AAC.2
MDLEYSYDNASEWLIKEGNDDQGVGNGGGGSSQVGPAMWAANVDPGCGMDMQTPIDLDTDVAVDAALVPLAKALYTDATCKKYMGKETASTWMVDGLD